MEWEKKNTIWKLEIYHSKIVLQNVQFFNVSGFQMVWLRIPTVQDNSDAMVRFMDELCNRFQAIARKPDHYIVWSRDYDDTKNYKCKTGIIIFRQFRFHVSDIHPKSPFTYPLNIYMNFKRSWKGICQKSSRAHVGHPPINCKILPPPLCLS